jgi:hypothetical protein
MRTLTVLGIGLALIGIGVSVNDLLGTVLIVAGIIVSAASPFVRLKPDPTAPTQPDKPTRIGYIGRKGSQGNLREARFGKDLDVGIDNAGEVDAGEAKFSD